MIDARRLMIHLMSLGEAHAHRCLSCPAALLGEESYGEPTIRDTGHREHEGAGRPPIDVGLRARTHYMAAPCDWPGCAASADQELSCRPPAPVRRTLEGAGRRIIGLDIHRAFAE